MSYTFTATGLPPGLSLVGNTVTGTPTAAGTYSVTFTVSDGVSSVSDTVSVTIAPVAAPRPFWQLILSADSGSYWQDALTLQLSATADAGSYWRDRAAVAPPPPVITVGSGSYWRDSALAAIADSGSYWRDSTAPRPIVTVESGLYWLDSVLVSSLYDPATDDLLARFTGTYMTAQKEAIDALIRGLKADGLWDKWGCVQVYAAAVASDAALNWKGASFTASPIASPTFTAFQGWITNGSSSYIDTGYNPVADALYGTNAAALGLYSLTSGTSNGIDLGSKDDDDYITELDVRDTANTAYGAINNDPNLYVQGTVSDGKTLVTVTRTNSTSISLYSGSSLLQTTTVASAQEPNATLAIGARNNVSLDTIDFYSARKYALFFAGASMTATDVANANSRFVTFLTAVGAL